MNKRKFLKILFWTVAILFLLSDIIIIGFALSAVSDDDKYVRSLLPVMVAFLFAPFFLHQPLLLSEIRVFTKYKMRIASKCCIIIGILISTIATGLYYLFFLGYIGFLVDLYHAVFGLLGKALPEIHNDFSLLMLANLAGIIISTALFAIGKHFAKKTDTLSPSCEQEQRVGNP